MFDFRFNTPIPSLNQGSGKHFYASALRAIDFSHDFTPKNDLFRKKFFSKSSRKLDSPFKLRP